MIKVLVMTNESVLERMITVTLTINGFSVKTVSHVSDVTFELEKNDFHVLLLDDDYSDVGHQIREKGFDVPILIFASQKKNIKGSVDYLPRPFEFPDLKLKMNALLKKRLRFADKMIETGHLRIDLANQVVMIKDKLIALGKMEFAILVSLARKAAKIVPREKMRMDLEAQGYFFNTNIYHHIKELKNKISEEASEHLRIRSVTGEGYLLTTE